VAIADINQYVHLTAATSRNWSANWTRSGFDVLAGVECSGTANDWPRCRG
jgi:hypothetical protein